jgi:hypothetical protein
MCVGLDPDCPGSPCGTISSKRLGSIGEVSPAFIWVVALSTTSTMLGVYNRRIELTRVQRTQPYLNFRRREARPIQDLWVVLRSLHLDLPLMTPPPSVSAEWGLV